MNNIKKVLVTGGAGYIGTTLCNLLLESGWEVILFDSFIFGKKPIENIANHPNLTVVEGDIRESNSLAKLLNNEVSVVHLASLSNDPSCDLNPEWSREINHQATVRLAEIAKSTGSPRFVFASSCSVYGNGLGNLSNETSPCNPVSLYAELKLKSEEAILGLMDKSFRPTIFRQATIFGYSRRMRFDLAINQMTMHAITKGKIHVLGGGEQWRPFLHVEDSALLFKKGLEGEQEKVCGRIFNAGSDENNFQILELAKKVKEVVGDVEISIAPDDADKRDYHVDFGKVKKGLGFRPSVEIADGIKKIAEYIRTDINRDYNGANFFNLKRLKESSLDKKDNRLLAEDKSY